MPLVGWFRSRSNLEQIFLSSFFVLAGYAFFLFVLEKKLYQSSGPGAAVLVYVLLRVLLTVGHSFFLSINPTRPRILILSTVLGTSFIEQVVFKAIWVAKTGVPAGLPPEASNLSTMMLHFATIYLGFLPFLIILALLGLVLGFKKVGREWF